MFPVRAVFWILVVAAFVPKDFSAPADGAFAQEAAVIAAHFDAGQARNDVQAAADDVCAGREQTCELVDEAADIAGFVVSLAADRVEAVARRHGDRAETEDLEQLLAHVATDQPVR